MADTNALFDLQLATFPGSYFGNTSLTTTIDDADAGTANIFQVPEACDLTGATAYCTAVSSSPDYKYTLQSVSTSTGAPDGTVLATTAEFTPSVGTQAHAFTSAYTASAGQTLAIVIEYGSGTISGAKNATFIDRHSNVKFILFPYQLVRSSIGSWQEGDKDAYPGIAVQTDITDIDICGIFATGDSTESVTTTGHRYAQRILIPSGENIEMHIDGFRFCGTVEAVQYEEFKVGAWSADGTELAAAAIDSRVQADPTATTNQYAREYKFTSPATVTDGTVVYFGFEETGDDLNIAYMVPGGLNGLKSWPGGDAFYASKWDGSSWTDDNTKRLLLNPILSSIHGSGGGGSSIPGPSIGVIG